MTTGIFKEPSTGYINKLNQQRSIAAELTKITGETYTTGAENEIILTFKDLMNDLKTAS